MKKDAVILIADDNPQHIEAMASSLYKIGARVVAADSVRGALELLEQKRVESDHFRFIPGQNPDGMNC